MLVFGRQNLPVVEINNIYIWAGVACLHRQVGYGLVTESERRNEHEMILIKFKRALIMNVCILLY